MNDFTGNPQFLFAGEEGDFPIGVGMPPDVRISSKKLYNFLVSLEKKAIKAPSAEAIDMLVNMNKLLVLEIRALYLVNDLDTNPPQVPESITNIPS